MGVFNSQKSNYQPLRATEGTRRAQRALSMGDQPIHQNLSTTFVDVPALIRHLRDLQFVGRVRIELSSYEGEIFFPPSRKLFAKEFDLLTGRISVGEEAFLRILVRAREPHGRIDVFRANGRADIMVDDAIARTARTTAAMPGDGPAFHLLQPQSRLELSGDWELLLNLIGELLRAVDESLSAVSLSFPEGFKNACTRLAGRFPFFHPARPVFRYCGGRITVKGYVEPETFTEAIGEALLILFQRLKDEPRFSTAHQLACKRIKDLLTERQSLYQRFLLTRHIKRLIGAF